MFRLKMAPWLCTSVEGKFKVYRVAQIQGQPLGDSPFIANEELGNMGALQQSLVLNIDAESVDLAKQQRSHAVSRARRVECKRASRIGRIHNIERLAPDVSAEFNRVAPSNHRKGVEILGDGRRKLTIRSRSWADLLIARHCKNRQHGCERICRKTGYGDISVLQRGLIQVATGVPETRRIHHRGRWAPIVLRHRTIATGDRMTGDARSQTPAAIR